MKTSQKATAGLSAVALALAAPIIVKWEGERRTGYLDIAGIATACVGHTKTAVVGKRYTSEDCRKLLTSDMEEHARLVATCIPPETPVKAQAAFLSLAFNIGPTAFCSSTVARRLDKRDYRGACEAISYWNKARIAGKLVTVRGLVNRRADERAYCLSGLS